MDRPRMPPSPHHPRQLATLHGGQAFVFGSSTVHVQRKHPPGPVHSLHPLSHRSLLRGGQTTDGEPQQ